MTTTPASVQAASPAATASQAKATPSLGTNLASNFTSFISLLTTQLKNQDPLSPLEATEFTSQLVQFTGVEQALKTNTNLESMIAMQKAGQLANAVGFLGSDVETAGNKVALADGKARFAYTLAKAAVTCEIVVKNEADQEVARIVGDPAKGPHVRAWDGRDANGVVQPDGLYTFTVAAKDATGQPVVATTSQTGRVTGVAGGPDGAGIVLTVNGVTVPLSDVKSVRSALAAA